MEKLCHHSGKLVAVRAIQFVSKGCVVVFEQKLLSLLGKGHFFPVIAYVDQFIGNQGVCSVQKSGACGNAVSERLIDIFQSPFN